MGFFLFYLHTHEHWDTRVDNTTIIIDNKANDDDDDDALRQ